MLEVHDLRRLTLGPVSFSLAPGEGLAVRGPSGAGKTLLLRALADLDPSTGAVTLDGVAREAIPAPEWRSRVGYLPAEPGWWGASVPEHFLDWPKAVHIAERLGLTIAIGGQPVAQLSTGERQRLALVRALERMPRVLLLDEPTAALDAVARDKVEALLAERRRAGLMVVWVTHDPEQARRVAGREMVL